MSELKPDTTPTPSEIEVHFEKSRVFRVIHANGVWFGADPQGNLHFTFYNERTPIPKKMVLKLNDVGQTIGEDESRHEGKQGLLREMEVDVVMSIPAALAFFDMFSQNVQTLKENVEAAQKLTPTV
jgi:hypothetical protein